MRVLVVDDDPQVRAVVRRGLEREGFEVAEAGDGSEALAVAADGVELAVLDLHLPGMSGLEVLSALRRDHPRLHVIMLTGAGSEADRVRGLVSGADDYVVKPFSARELAARAIAARRRREVPPAAMLDFGSLTLDLDARRVAVDGRTVDLTRREFDLLRHLALHPDRAFSRADLLREAWGSSPEWQNDRTITEHMRRIRNKIERDPGRPEHLLTVRGVGYRFEARPPSRTTRQHQQTDVQAAAPPSSGDAVVVVLLSDAVVVDATPGALDLLGATSPDQVLGRSGFDFVAQRSIDAATVRYEHTRAQRSPRPEVFALQRLDGQEVLVEIASTPVTWQGAAAIQVSLWDLSESTVRLQELATGVRSDVPDAVIVTDAALRIQSFNPAAEELYGWSEHEAAGRSLFDVAAPASEARDALDIEAALRRDGRWHGLLLQPRRDGSSVTVRSSMTMLSDSSDQPVGVVAVNRPVDRRQEAASSTRTGGAGDALDREISRGIEQAQFEVHYQPVVAIATGRCVGVEALVRWQHPERGLLGPHEFIDAAERSGAIIELGQQVLEQAADQWAAWRDLGQDVHVAVNLSPRQLGDGQLPRRVTEVLDARDMPRDNLWLEVTETALVADLEQATGVLHQIADLGVHVSIDDFGTGWASLTYLRQFPIHSLKVDRVFVSGLESDSNDTAIVTSILSLGTELGLTVVAEGIETPGQRDALARLGCRLGQGYLYARPLPPGALELDLDGRHDA